jgi:hypothetical protein
VFPLPEQAFKERPCLRRRVKTTRSAAIPCPLGQEAMQSLASQITTRQISMTTKPTRDRIAIGRNSGFNRAGLAAAAHGRQPRGSRDRPSGVGRVDYRRCDYRCHRREQRRSCAHESKARLRLVSDGGRRRSGAAHTCFGEASGATLMRCECSVVLQAQRLDIRVARPGHGDLGHRFRHHRTPRG